MYHVVKTVPESRKEVIVSELIWRSEELGISDIVIPTECRELLERSKELQATAVSVAANEQESVLVGQLASGDTTVDQAAKTLDELRTAKARAGLEPQLLRESAARCREQAYEVLVEHATESRVIAAIGQVIAQCMATDRELVLPDGVDTPAQAIACIGDVASLYVRKLENVRVFRACVELITYLYSSFFWDINPAYMERNPHVRHAHLDKQFLAATLVLKNPGNVNAWDIRHCPEVHLLSLLINAGCEPTALRQDQVLVIMP